MRPEELPAREWRRRHLRILAAARRRRQAAEMRDIRRTPIHPAYERWLKYRAVGGHRCRPYTVRLPDGHPFNAYLTAHLSAARGPHADVVIIDDPARADEVPPQMRAAVGEWWADVERRERQR